MGTGDQTSGGQHTAECTCRIMKLYTCHLHNDEPLLPQYIYQKKKMKKKGRAPATYSQLRDSAFPKPILLPSKKGKNHPECHLRPGGRGVRRGGSSASVGSPASFLPDGVPTYQSCRTCPLPCARTHPWGDNGAVRAKGHAHSTAFPPFNLMSQLKKENKKHQILLAASSARQPQPCLPFSIKSHTPVRITRQGAYHCPFPKHRFPGAGSER